MQKYFYILIGSIFFGNFFAFAQTQTDTLQIVKSTTKYAEINPLAPAKAAFYSAILPGLGQAYNKKYWKIPLVYAALGAAIYNYVDSVDKYNSFRDAYKRRLEGYTDDQYSYIKDSEKLVTSQKFYERNRDLSTFFIIGIYIINIIDANVDAHLKQFNVNDKLSLRPDVQTNDLNNQRNVALTINYQF